MAGAAVSLEPGNYHVVLGPTLTEQERRDAWERTCVEALSLVQQSITNGWKIREAGAAMNKLRDLTRKP